MQEEGTSTVFSRKHRNPGFVGVLPTHKVRGFLFDGTDMDNGWIKIHRKLQRSQMYRHMNSKQRDVMIQCLLLANHEENEWEWGSKIHKCKPGQFITSLSELAKKCAPDVSIQNIRTSLLKLEKWHFLTYESTKTGRLITICNWETYQSIENPDQQRDQQTANKELTTNKNVKNVKKVKEEIPFNDNSFHRDQKNLVPMATKKTRTPKPKFSPEDKPYQFAEFFLGKIIEYHPTSRFQRNPPDLGKWAADLDLMCRRDGRDIHEAGKLVKWLFDHYTPKNDFDWRDNVQSPKKLREHYDRLIKKAQRTNGATDHSHVDRILDGLYTT